MYQLRKKNLANSFAIYGRGRELFRPPTYSPLLSLQYNLLLANIQGRNM